MPRIDITENYRRKRQFEPSLCQPGSFRTISLGHGGEKGVICRKKGEASTSLQSILEPRRKKK